MPCMASRVRSTKAVHLLLQRLAREVVALEERVLQAHSQQLKAERAAEASREEAKRSAVTCSRAQTECASLNATLDALQVTIQQRIASLSELAQ